MENSLDILPALKDGEDVKNSPRPWPVSASKNM